MSQAKFSRRDLLKLIAAATGATVLSSVPTKWVTPIVEIGAIPVHAQGSQPPGAISGFITVQQSFPTRPTQNNPSTLPIPPLYVGTLSPLGIGGIVINGTFNGSTYLTSYLISPVPPGNNYIVRAGINASGCGYSGDVSPVVVTSGNTTPNVNFNFNCRPIE